MLQTMRRRSLAARLSQHLEPDERIIVASVGLHPRAMFSIPFLAVFTLGYIAGLALGSLIGGLITMFLVLMATLSAWWYYLSRNPFGEQPAGLEPWVALTDQRIIYGRSGWGDRVSATFSVPVGKIASFTVKRYSVFMPPTHLMTTDSASVTYRILDARRIHRELAKLRAGSSEHP